MPVVERIIQSLSTYFNSAGLRRAETNTYNRFIDVSFKWSFDVVKNFITLVAVRVIAIKAQSLTTTVISNLLLIIFSAYVANSFMEVAVSFVHRPDDRAKRAMYTILLVIPITVVIGLLLTFVETNVLQELIAFQSK